MTRNICVSAFICGSHICSVQPSEFDSISVGPPSRPSTETLSRQPSASIMGMVVSSSCGHAGQWHGQRIRRKHAASPHTAPSRRTVGSPQRITPAMLHVRVCRERPAPAGSFLWPTRTLLEGKSDVIQEAPMAMTMTGEVQLAAPRQAVWDKLNDPDVLKACIPGCEEL